MFGIAAFNSVGTQDRIYKSTMLHLTYLATFPGNIMCCPLLIIFRNPSCWSACEIYFQYSFRSKLPRDFDQAGSSALNKRLYLILISTLTKQSFRLFIPQLSLYPVAKPAQVYTQIRQQLSLNILLLDLHNPIQLRIMSCNIPFHNISDQSCTG